MKKTLLALLFLGLITTVMPARAAQRPGGARKNAAEPAAAQPADPALEEKIKNLIAQLGDNDFNVRVAATAALKKIGKPALPQLEQAATSDDVEIRSRAKTLIRDISSPTSAQELQGSFKKPDAGGGLPGVGGGGQNPLGGLGDVGGMLGGLLGGAGGGKGGGNDAMGMLGGLLGGGGGGQGGGLDISSLLGGMLGGQAHPAATAPTGPRIMLMPPMTAKEGDKEFRISHKVVIVVEVTEMKDGQETKRVVVADDEEDLQKKDPEAYKVYMKNVRGQ